MTMEMFDIPLVMFRNFLHQQATFGNKRGFVYLHAKLLSIWQLAFRTVTSNMAMIGVPLMSKGINPYKQNSSKIKNDDRPKESCTRRRYQSEHVLQPATVVTRKRYQSVTHGEKENKGLNGNLDESKR